MQFGFAGAITAHAIDVHAGLNHLGGDDGGVGFVGGYGRDDVGTFGGFCGAAAYGEFQARVFEVAHQLFSSRRVHIKQADFFNAHQVLKGQGLKLALCAIANQGHHAAVGAGQCFCGQRRCCGSAQGSGQCQFAQQ